ncbi:21243_t:CDS:2 [Gigaspora margarita]|uniref:21243_t:CDS:1 n=1 Tax=Gigaspora margarita TaxID=4874 RepID=A0ABN7V6V1_GIGMA|nr:21243_t:CDS:2 [Gigaspora margarita]
MEAKLNYIPKNNYKKIKENSSRLKIPTSYDLIIYNFNEFLTKHAKRRQLYKYVSTDPQLSIIPEPLYDASFTHNTSDTTLQTSL